MTDNNGKLIRWDAQHIFSQDFTDYHYKLTQQHIEALIQIYPQIEWDKRWQNKDLYTEDEIDAFAADLLYRLMNPVDCAEQEIDNCLEYNNNVSFLSYTPQNPHTQPDFVPAGYPNQPFFKFGSIIPGFLPDWLEDFVSDWLTEMSGYEPDDVLTVINSFPLFANWQEILESGLPRITLSFSGTGIVQIRLLLVPFGGRAIISIDVEPNIADILENLFEGNIRSIELERDFSSLPMETDIDHIEEIVLTEDIEHTIYITFLPVLDATLIPFKYGGGIRSVTLCGDFAFSEAPTDPCTIEILLADDVFFEEEYVPQIFGTTWENTVDAIAALEAAYDTTPQSIGAEIPVAAPSEQEKYALCAAILAFLQMYAAQKIAMIQSRNFLQIAWDEVLYATTQAFDTTVDALLGLFGWDYGDCAIDSDEAITALSDDAAIEDVQCQLLDALDGTAISESSFNTAIDALTLGSGNAQIIGCMLSNDNDLQIYLRFLEIYNNKLIAQGAGTDFECDCIPGPYRLLVWDFANGLGDWEFDQIVVSGNYLVQMGALDGANGLKGVKVSSSIRQAAVKRTIDPAWRFRSGRITTNRENGIGNGTFDATILRLRPTPNSTTGEISIVSGGFRPNGVEARCQTKTAAPGYNTGGNQLWLAASVTLDDSPVSNIWISKVELVYVDGFHEGGYVIADTDICS